MVYATCSILPEENELQIKAFLDRQNDAEIIEIPNVKGLGRQIFPGEEGMDGFYYAKIQKLA